MQKKKLPEAMLTWRAWLHMASLGHNEVNSSPPDKMAATFSDDIFRCIFINDKFCISIEISLMYVPKCPINNNPALV